MICIYIYITFSVYNVKYIASSVHSTTAVAVAFSQDAHETLYRALAFFRVQIPYL